MNDVIVEIPRLRVQIDWLLNELMRHEGSEVAISHDYFWAIHDARMVDVFEVPDVTIGQVSETLEFLDVDQERWEGGSATLLGAPIRWLSYLLASVAAELEYGEPRHSDNHA